MSALNNRTTVARPTAPMEPIVLTPAVTYIPGCPCGQGPIADDGNPYTAPSVSTGGYLACPGVEDMRVQVDVNGWDNDYSDLRLQVRMRFDGQGLYEFSFTPSGPGTFPTLYPNGDYALKVYVAGSPTTLGGPTNAAHPTAGDTLELSVIGTSIVASKNGTPMFSVTDSSFSADPDGNYLDVSGSSSSAAFSIDITYEDYCP